MSSEYVLAINVGTTSAKAALFPKDARLAHSRQYFFEQKYPNPGWCEQDPYAILESTIKSVNEVAELIVPYGSITAVGITNQRETVIAWDKVTGKPLYNAIVWLDLRTYDTVKALTMDGSKDRFRHITGLPISTYFTALKIRWLLDNVDEVSDAVKEGRCLFGTVDSWLTYNLTGGHNNGGIHVTDVTNASRYMLMDLKTLSWSEEVCHELNIPLETLPKIVPSSGYIGIMSSHQLHSAVRDVPITAILGDQQSALVGHGCIQEGQGKMTLGKGCFMLVNTGQQIVPASFGILTTVAFQREGGDVYYALEGSIANTGRAVQWLCDKLQLIETPDEIEKLALTVPNTGGVTFVPAFTGLFAPYWRPDARAVITGMTLGTTKAHICRAVLEAVALQVLDVVEAMEKHIGRPLEMFYVDGGMTRNALFLQMQADALLKDIYPAELIEFTSFGVAYAAGLAVHFWDKVPLQSLISNLGGHRKITPRPDALAQRGTVRRRWNDALQRSLNLEE
ncbi:glycerol kinase, putative [Perkinsus marinus ATCC 50983]|uniref:glycerol kinase n=1 Tax=Perkinsus marinus (strain ATCC 50983 / TXsc) TaxID=423536 RepID=C5LIT3_PERM5|nr:glycerol kinase, putative [Perkinsus marinus ATCC 50983]EER03486.1 glycerol kinase, putative [Perkinsus marinus ATCC 50983]|eukprot:XP_002771670.1 glycerol kinase, putative [Perkinsus marinus ATCC 50983]